MAQLPDDPARELDIARRRIEQLEATLVRRTELLEWRQAELAGIKSSKAFRLAHLGQRVADRLLPMHTGRRATAKALARKLGQFLDRRESGPSGGVEPAVDAHL